MFSFCNSRFKSAQTKVCYYDSCREFAIPVFGANLYFCDLQKYCIINHHMALNKQQKKFLKKNLRKLPLDTVSKELGISEKDLLDYLKSIWPEDKYQKFINSSKNPLVAEEKPETAEVKTNLKFRLKKNFPIFAFLAFLVFAVYSNSLKNEFLSDDIAGILQDKNLGNLPYYLVNQPINFFRYFFYFIVFKTVGLNPVFFRLLNIFFHLGSVWIIYILISLLINQPIALIASSIFAIHPIEVEGIVWITGGIHAQYSFFVLLSFLFYFFARSNSWLNKFYVPSLLSFFIALFTTEKSAILPLLLLLFEIFFGQIKKNWKRLLPYFILSGVCASVVFFGGGFGRRVFLLQSQYYQEGGLYNPLTQIPTAISSYLSLLFWPDRLTLYHSEMFFSPGQYLLMFIVTIGYFGLLVYTFLNKKYRYLSFWLCFFFISLLPMLTPFKVAWIVAERYVYLGSIGIFVLIGIGVAEIGKITKNKYTSFVVLGILLIFLSIRTIIRNIDWKNQDNLWLAADRTSPSSPQNHNNLGDLYSRHGNFPKAAEEFLLAIRLKPDYGDAFHNLANTYRQMGKNDLAAESYTKAISFNPTLWQSYQNLTVIYFERGKLDEALETITKAKEINPENPDLHLIAGIVYHQLNKDQEAKEEFLKTLEIDPGNQKAKELLSSLK